MSKRTRPRTGAEAKRRRARIRRRLSRPRSKRWQFFDLIQSQRVLDRVVAVVRAEMSRICSVPNLTQDEFRSRALAWAAERYPDGAATFDGNILSVTVVPPRVAEHISLTIDFGAKL